jgi:cobalt-zinc-cadmium resistance protein CzcA
MSFSEIAEAIGENVENAGGGVIQLGGEQLTVRAAGRVQTSRKSRSCRSSSARAPRRCASGRGRRGHRQAVRTGTATYNGEEAVLGAALMLAGENSRLVAKAVDAKLKEIQPKLPRA